MTDRGDVATPTTSPGAWRRWTSRRLIWGLLGLAAIAHAGYSLAYIGHNLDFDDGEPFEDGFETGNLDRWAHRGYLELCCPHSATFVRDDAGKGGRFLKFDLRAGDPDVRGAKRAELRLKSVPFGEDRWYAVRLRVPADWQAAPEYVTVLQWHAVDDRFLGERGRPPPLRLLVDHEHWRLVGRWDERALTGTPFWRGTKGGNQRLLWTAPLDRGVWTDWLVRARWSSDGNGELDVWKDGTLIVQDAGPNTYNDLLAPYFKVGIYVPGWKRDRSSLLVTRREVLVDAVRQSATELLPAAAR